MKLTDLDPRWLIADGRRVGFVFISPTQRPRADGTKQPVPWRQSCFVQPTKASEQEELFDAMFGWAHLVQGCNQQCGWTIEGGSENANFETISVTPSLDGSPGGLWHGYITNGEIK